MSEKEIDMNAGKKFVAIFFLCVLGVGVISAAGGTYLYLNWEKHFPPMAELQAELKEARRAWEAREEEAEDEMEKLGINDWVDSIEEQYDNKSEEMLENAKMVAREHADQMIARERAAHAMDDPSKAGVSIDASNAAHQHEHANSLQPVALESSIPATTLSSAVESGASEPTSNTSTGVRFSWADTLPLVWLAGALCFGLRYVLLQNRLGRFRRSLSCVQSGREFSLLEDCRRQIGVSTGVELRIRR